MKAICIFLTDFNGINESIIIRSRNELKKLRVKKIFLIGDKNKFSKIYKIFSKLNKFIFINITFKKNYFHYLDQIMDTGIKLYKKNKISSIINMPLNKKRFFNNTYDGFTEYFCEKIEKKVPVNMLMYNQDFSVCPLTTHIQLKDVDAKINKNNLKNCIKNLVFFYKKIINKKVKIIVLGVNPHASKDLNNKTKDKKVLYPVINYFKNKNIDIEGPVSADTSFVKTKNKVYVGMYHDQVLIPFKLKNKFNGVNITIGKKILRISPDHGTAENISKKIYISNESFIRCIKFCEKYA